MKIAMHQSKSIEFFIRLFLSQMSVDEAHFNAIRSFRDAYNRLIMNH